MKKIIAAIVALSIIAAVVWAGKPVTIFKSHNLAVDTTVSGDALGLDTVSLGDVQGFESISIFIDSDPALTAAGGSMPGVGVLDTLTVHFYRRGGYQGGSILSPLTANGDTIKGASVPISKAYSFSKDSLNGELVVVLRYVDTTTALDTATGNSYVPVKIAVRGYK